MTVSVLLVPKAFGSVYYFILVNIAFYNATHILHQWRHIAVNLELPVICIDQSQVMNRRWRVERGDGDKPHYLKRPDLSICAT